MGGAGAQPTVLRVNELKKGCAVKTCTTAWSMKYVANTCCMFIVLFQPLKIHV